MRIAALLLLVALAACSGESSPEATSTTSSSTTMTTVASSSDSGGPPDARECAELKIAEEKLEGVQVLAQIRSQIQIDQIHGGSLPFDAGGFLAAIKTLRAVAPYQRKAPLDNVTEGLDTYRHAGQVAKRMLAAPGPVPASDFGELAGVTGPSTDVTKFLLYQSSIGEALTKACPH